MVSIPLGTSGLTVPTIGVGCMRIADLPQAQVDAFVDTAIEHGANFFDHADCYGAGKSEERFGLALKRYDREQVFIQTKCGIVPGVGFDFSKDHILRSVDGSLKRLQTDYLDVLLLHRPDALVEPDEVAEAFEQLRASGKVRHFGVSNQNPYQMALLQKSLSMPLVVNQLQFGLMHTPMIDSGIHVNMKDDAGINRDGGVLDYCRLHDITVQPWSPMQFGFFEGCFVDNDRFPALNAELTRLAEVYGVSKTTIAVAWILRHPAKMQPITGTTNLTRLADSFRAADIRLTREDWYALYKAAGNVLP
ncbi:MAG: aldo/keto reductase [Clostridia bacterium]|nr:aldo/keto reductase [Clostridia bacterium]